MPDRTTTERGFDVYDEFTDLYGSKIRVQASSLATDDAVWIFAEHETPKLQPRMRERLEAAGFTRPVDLAELAAMLEPSPHLNVEQAKRVVAALSIFIAEHEEPEDGKRG